MRLNRQKVFTSLFIALFLLSGCTNYVITIPLENKLYRNATYNIGIITDELPLDMATEKKPTIEDINMFKDHLSAELGKLDFFNMLEYEELEGRYVVNGAIMEYRKGSGAARFFFGILAPNASAKLLTSLELVDTKTNDIVFSGNFKAEVSDWTISGKEIYKKIAKDFAKALKKQMKKFN